MRFPPTRARTYAFIRWPRGAFRVARYHRCDSAATSLRRRCDTALRHRPDVTATNARPISEIPEMSWRHLQRYTTVAVVATALRHRSDVAATQRCDIAPTSLRQTRDPLAKSLRRRGGAIHTDTALEKRMRTRKPRPIFLSAAAELAEPLTCTKSARLVLDT